MLLGLRRFSLKILIKKKFLLYFYVQQFVINELPNY